MDFWAVGLAQTDANRVKEKEEGRLGTGRPKENQREAPTEVGEPKETPEERPQQTNRKGQQGSTEAIR